MRRILPPPRPGLAGAWDRFVGPGMTEGEQAIVCAASVLGVVVVAWRLWMLDMSIPQILVGALIGVDVIGGAVCNMTDTTKRWYHRAGRTFGDHFSFTLPHLLHIALVAWMFRSGATGGFDLTYLLVLGGWLLVSVAVVLKTPGLLKSPMAATLYLVALGLSLYALGPTFGLEWFVPVLFIKLLIGHALPLEKV